MKFKFLTVLALTGMVFAGCNSNKNSGKEQGTSSAMSDSSLTDTTMTNDTAGTTGAATATGTTNGDTTGAGKSGVDTTNRTGSKSKQP